MKHRLLTLFLLFYGLFAQAGTKTVVANNSTGWNFASNWSPAGVPANGDVVVVPSGQIISVKGNIYGTPTLLDIRVYGSLNFEPSGKLDLAQASNLQVYSGGQITSQNTHSEVIWIGGVTKYQGGTDPSPLLGPVYASSATGSSPSGFINAVVLPVQLKKFTAVMQQDGVVIDWSTAEELKLDHFTIEKSEDGNLWRTLAMVLQKGNFSSYRFVDHTNRNPLNYYRLKMNDQDGIFAYSPVVRINFPASGGVVIYPNPVSEQLQLFLPGHTTTSIHLQLISSTGQVVQEMHALLVSGRCEMPVHSLRKGCYSLRIMDRGTMIGRQHVFIN